MNWHVSTRLALVMATLGEASAAAAQNGFANNPAPDDAGSFSLLVWLLAVLAVALLGAAAALGWRRWFAPKGRAPTDDAGTPNRKLEILKQEDRQDSAAPSIADETRSAAVEYSEMPEFAALRSELSTMKDDLQQFIGALRADVADIRAETAAGKEELSRAVNTIGEHFATVIRDCSHRLEDRVEALLAKAPSQQSAPSRTGKEMPGDITSADPVAGAVRGTFVPSLHTPEDLVGKDRTADTPVAMAEGSDVLPSQPEAALSIDRQDDPVEDRLAPLSTGKAAPPGEPVTRDGVKIAFGKVLKPVELDRLANVAKSLRGPEAVAIIFKELNQIGGERRLMGHNLMWPAAIHGEVLDFVSRHAGCDASLIWPAEEDRIEHSQMQALPGASSGVSKVKELVCPGYRLVGEERPVKALVVQF